MDRFIIERGGMVRIDDGQGMLLQVRSGALWVTQPGDPRDYCLKAGQSFRVQRAGTVLAQALEGATVTFGEAPTSRPATAGL